MPYAVYSYGQPYSILSSIASASLYTPYTETVIKVKPCGHEVDCKIEGSKIRLFLKQEFENSESGRYQEFLVRLQAMASAAGWQVYTSNPTISPNVNLYWTCPHGSNYGSIESWLGTTLAPLQFAQMVWAKMQPTCQCAYVQSSYTWTFSPPQVYSGFSSGHPTLDALLRLCPGLQDASADCPECHLTGVVPLGNLIPHVNDKHQWTRERIADWLETLPFDLSIKPPTKGNENGTHNGSSAKAKAELPPAGGSTGIADYTGYIQSVVGVL